jgi:hypothetical protein
MIGVGGKPLPVLAINAGRGPLLTPNGSCDRLDVCRKIAYALIEGITGNEAT